mmetsp:Transcript_6716/g.19881  ORF Transcript_6716/g.19881 Transcript_6716/m.19881 type:complete len:213 (-) Transcript_6716:102-740(-)
MTGQRRVCREFRIARVAEKIPLGVALRRARGALSISATTRPTQRRRTFRAGVLAVAAVFRGRAAPAAAPRAAVAVAPVRPQRALGVELGAAALDAARELARRRVLLGRHVTFRKLVAAARAERGGALGAGRRVVRGLAPVALRHVRRGLALPRRRGLARGGLFRSVALLGRRLAAGLGQVRVLRGLAAGDGVEDGRRGPEVAAFSLRGGGGA